MSNLEECKKYMLIEENIINFLPQKNERNLVKPEIKVKSNTVKDRLANHNRFIILVFLYYIKW